jgi:hypothetical protein
MPAKAEVGAYVRRGLLAVLLIGAYLSPSPLPSHYQEALHPRALAASYKRASGRAEAQDGVEALRRLRGFQSSGGFQCPSDLDAQQHFTTGTYRGSPGIEDRHKWAELFQDYMGVPYTSEWETETWNQMFVYTDRNSTGSAPKTPTHMVMYHWHRYTDYTPYTSGIDEHLLFATPLGGVESKNPYTEWMDMNAVVAPSPIWTNRWRSSSSGGGPAFGCPTMETSFQLAAYRGKDMRKKNYHWVMWREVMNDGVIYASVRWIEVTDACKNDLKTCPPFDPLKKGLFGTESDPKYVNRFFVKAYDTPYIMDEMLLPSISFKDHEFVDEIGGYTDTKIYVHEFFNRTSYARKFSGFGYTGYKATAI